MKLSVSAYRAHASAHKKILSSSYQTHYGSTTASHSSSHVKSGLFSMEPIDPQKLIVSKCGTNDPRSPTETLISGDLPASSMGTSQEEDSSNQNSSDCKSPGQSFLYRSTSFSSFLERKPSSVKQHRNQYTDIDLLNKNDIETIEQNEENGQKGTTYGKGWRSLRAVGRFYCQLRKIKRQYMREKLQLLR